MNKIFIGKYNAVHMFVTADNEGIEWELRDRFSFMVPGARFMPAFKRGTWNGKINLYNTHTKLMYVGLIDKVKEFAKERGYTVQIDPDIVPKSHVKMHELEKFIDTLNLPFEPYDYQKLSTLRAINEGRMTLVSPTGSGKSLIIYMIARFLDMKTLIIVPTTNLVHQMAQDFKEYGYTDECHKIYSGKDKDPITNVTILCENGKEYNFSGNESIKTLNRGNIKAIEVTEEDEIDDRWLSKKSFNEE